MTTLTTDDLLVQNQLMEKELIQLRHLYKVMKALYVTEDTYYDWFEYKDHYHPTYRRFALKCRARAVVLHDRLLNEEYVPIGKQR